MNIRTQPVPALSPARIVTEAQHLSLVTYQLPAARAAALLPQPLRQAGFAVSEQPQLQIISYLDQRKSLFNVTEGFEQTSYWLTLQREATRYHWQLDTVVGSLAAVSARQLWQAPWHLGAMEFQARYDETEGRYQTYRLQTQSESRTASWELRDAGRTVSSIQSLSTINECFVRRDGSIGLRRLQFHMRGNTAARVINARCEWLAQSGLLTRHELAQPHHATLCRTAQLEIAPPTLLLSQSRELRLAA